MSPYTTIWIQRYRLWALPMGFLSMAFFHIVLWRRRATEFHKLMGTGRGGTFDKVPDLRRWTILSTHNTLPEIRDPQVFIRKHYGRFISAWVRLFTCQNYVILLESYAGHGAWDGKIPFRFSPAAESPAGRVGTLTRATIRISRLRYFWKHVAPVAEQLYQAPGYLFSIGIGEVPWIKQATFSIWESVDDMKAFAYGMKAHRDVIQKTRKEQWYSEDMFVRFRVLGSSGALVSGDPLRTAINPSDTHHT